MKQINSIKETQGRKGASAGRGKSLKTIQREMALERINRSLENGIELTELQKKILQEEEAK